MGLSSPGLPVSSGSSAQTYTPTGVALTDTSALQALIDTGGRILLNAPLGIVSVGTIVMKTGAHLDLGGATLQLAAGTNADLITSLNFGTLTGTSTNSGTPQQFSIRNGVLDGNRANNSSGWAFRVFACNYDVDGVQVINGKSGGVWSEWGTGGTNMEARWRNFRINNCEGTALDWNGPHDSQFVNGVINNDSAGPTGTYGLRTRGNAAGEIFEGVHVWGKFATAWSLERLAIASSCVAEGATGTNLFIGANKVQWHGTIFGTNGTNPSEVMLALGGGGMSTQGYDVQATVWNIGSGATAVQYGSSSGDQGGSVRLSVTLGSAALSSGTVSSNTHARLIVCDDRSKSVYQSPGQTGAAGVVPTDHSLAGWSIDPAAATSSNVLTSGTVYWFKIKATDSRSVTKLWTNVFTAGSGLTANQCLMGLYDSSGAQLAVSGDQATAWASTGNKSATITGTPVVAGNTYYIGMLAVGTTPPAIVRGTGTGGLANIGIAAAPYRFNTGATGQTALPASITPTALALLTSAYFVGMS